MIEILLGLILITIWGLVIRELRVNSNSISKERILKHKKEQALIQIMDKELEIEASWILLRLAEKKRDAVIVGIAVKKAAMEAEKVKTPCDMDLIRKMNKELIEMGYTTEKAKGDKQIYKGIAASYDSEVEGYRGKIEQSAMQREYAKMNLVGLERLTKNGWVENYEKFEKEEMKDILIRKPIFVEKR